MTEHDVERLARQLGERHARLVDAGRVADRVVARLRSERRRSGSSRRTWRVALAVAAVVAMLFVTDEWTGRQDAEPAGGSAAGIALGTLDVEALGEALDSLVLAAPVSEIAGGGLGTLSVAELEQLLAAMEG
jgi:hypothetical protein